MQKLLTLLFVSFVATPFAMNAARAEPKQDANAKGTAFFESKIRPILVQHCYECHSEQAKEQQGGLLLDRQSGWINGGVTNAAVVPGELDASLLITAVRYQDDDLQMPPDKQLDATSIALLESWVARGAPGPAEDMGDTEFSRLGDQPYIFQQAKYHWAFQPVRSVSAPTVESPLWNRSPIDQFVFDKLATNGIKPTSRAKDRELIRRLRYDLTGLPPTQTESDEFAKAIVLDRNAIIEQTVQRLLDSPEFGQHIARMWLDVVRYADTDSAYRPDTKTPHYFPFAFSYRDYVIDAFNNDKAYDQFLKEQFAADLIGYGKDDPELAALGFLGVAPHARQASGEALDDWIDLTTRGLMGVTVACARCHDHKFEPVPTVDYYSLRGIFNSIVRPNPLDEKQQPILANYQPADVHRADYEKKRAAIDKKIADSAGKKAKNNNRPVSLKIRETELAELLLFHPGAPARSMIVMEAKSKPPSFVHVRGDAQSPGETAPPRFLKILDPQQSEFPNESSGRLELIEKIASSDNPLTARVFVNRVWGHLIGSHLVATASDFGLQGEKPTHPKLLDFLADDFVNHGWSTKRLVKQIVTSETYQQSSRIDESKAAVDPTNHWLWRANRKRLSIEALRDSLLAVSGQLDLSSNGHPSPLWGKDYTRRRAIYGYINRFNLDPTLRAFDFPTPMQSHAKRTESIVAPQSLFLMNSSFVSGQAHHLAKSPAFESLKSDQERIDYLFAKIYQRKAVENESARVMKFVKYQTNFREKAKPVERFDMDPWPMVAQSLLMSNEFQYVD